MVALESSDVMSELGSSLASVTGKSHEPGPVTCLPCKVGT